MVEITKTIRKYLGEVLTVTGAGIFVYNFFTYFQDLSIKISELLGFSWNGTKMIYSFATSPSTELSLYLLTVGIVLFVSGILVMYNKRR